MGRFLLELDTTPPQITIQVPHFVHLDDDVGEVTIISNEDLDVWQQFYLIDASGRRHDFIFDYLGASFSGILSLHPIATGIATIYAQAQDTVWNRSALVSASFEIRPPQFGGRYGVLTVLAKSLTPLGFR